MSTPRVTQPAAGEAGVHQHSEFEVVPGKRYRFRIGASDEAGREGPRGLIGKLEFLDARGSKIAGAPEGSAQTDRHGPVVYLPTHIVGVTESLVSENLLVAPANANRVRVQLRNWKCSPDVVIHTPLELIQEQERALARYEFPVQDSKPHELEMMLRSKVRHARAAILAFEFVDRAGAVITGPYDECISSPRFGPFRYLGATTGGAEMRIPVHPPRGATRLCLAVYPWKVAADTLAVVGEPQFALDIPEGLDAADWSLLSSRDWSEPHPLSEGRDGLVYIALDCIGIRRQSGEAPVVLVDFIDDAGRSVAEADAYAGNPLSIRIDSPTKPARRGSFFHWPTGATAVRFKLASTESYSLLVRESVDVQHVPAQWLPDRTLEPFGPGQSIDARYSVSSLWTACFELDGFALDVDNTVLEITLTLLDAAGRLVSPKGVLLTAEHATVEIKGSVLSVVPHALASGSQGVVRFASSVTILPPRGAITLTTGILNSRVQGVALALNVRAYDTIANDRLVPESISEIIAMDEGSPDKACELAESYWQRHGQDPSVMTHLLDVYRRFGELGKTEIVARKALAAKGPKLAKLHLKARHALALLQELDPRWLPVAGLAAPVSNRPGKESAMRVAHLFKTTVPVENTGGSIRCLNIVNFQRKVGMRPLVVTPLGYPDVGGTGQPWELEVIDRTPYYRLNGVGRHALRAVTSTTQLEFAAMLTGRLLGEEGVDIVQASSGYRGYEQALVGLAVSRALGVPFVYEVRSYHEHTWRGRTDWLLMADHTRRRVEQENRCMREADAVVTICETMKQGLVERGIPAEKVFVVPNSVDLEKFHEAEPSAELRARLALGEDLVAGYISNVSEREGHGVLLRAIARVRESGVSMKCLVVGEGPELGRLRTLAAQLGIAEHVVFTGEVAHEQIPAYYALIDLFVIPRIGDFASDFVTPMKPFEAMAMGRPLIVSDRPALLEIVGAEGQRGLVFRAGDHLDLADRLVELANSPDRRKALALEGRRWIEAERSWDKTIRIYEKVYAYAKRVAADRLTAKAVDSP